MKILAIESSCDETAAAVVEDGRIIRSSVIDSQVEEHKLYGGVVPEIASRRHVENIGAVVQKALDDAGETFQSIDAVAVTYAPGLIGALLVGVNYAKGVALASGKELIPVHHIRGHIAANYLTHPDLTPPFLCLVASGGHSHIIQVNDYTDFTIIGRTRDDAAGEAFDKAARVLGFPYPGGIHIDRAAQQGRRGQYKLPKPKVNGSDFDFSFSGLKTAVINISHHAQQVGEAIDVNNLAADFQGTVAGILTAALNDEFQEEVYANPDLTVEQLNELYASLAAEYGLVVDSPYFDMDSFSKGWFTTNQYFDSPFYAIDYALSGCVAMQFLQMGLQDYGASLKTYEALVTQSADDSFLTVLEAVGLDSPFAVETLEQTAQTLQTFLEGDDSFAAADAVQQDADAA